MFPLLIIFLIFACQSCISSKVNYLAPNEEINFYPKAHRTGDRFQVYCYEGKPKSLLYLWQSIFLNINLDTEDYTQYEGPTAEAVQKEYEAHRSSWTFNPFSTKSKNMKLDPFNQSCVGIESNDQYTVKLKLIHIDYWKVLLLIFGVFLFVSANKLSENVVFYYLCGVSFGITASFLILIYFVSRLIPRKSLMYGVFATGWTVSFYLFHMIKDNLRTIFELYRVYVLYYTLFSGIISFVFCYKWGPIKDQKTRNLIRWSLQGLGLVSVFLSSHFQEAAVAQIMLILILHNVPSKWISTPRNYLKKKFPPKVELLSNDEYYEQGVRETNRNLDELRKYCLSPECKQWKTALKLKDVKRFASFIEGNSHLSDDEILEYETSYQQTDLTDDDEEEDTSSDEMLTD